MTWDAICIGFIRHIINDPWTFLFILGLVILAFPLIQQHTATLNALAEPTLIDLDERRPQGVHATDKQFSALPALGFDGMQAAVLADFTPNTIFEIVIATHPQFDTVAVLTTEFHSVTDRQHRLRGHFLEFIDPGAGDERIRTNGARAIHQSSSPTIDHLLNAGPRWTPAELLAIHHERVRRAGQTVNNRRTDEQLIEAVLQNWRTQTLELAARGEFRPVRKHPVVYRLTVRSAYASFLKMMPPWVFVRIARERRLVRELLGSQGAQRAEHQR